MATMTSTPVLDEVISARRSVREFLPTSVPVETVLEILEVANRCPSGHNTQPWLVHVVTGDAMRRLSDAILVELDDPLCRDKHRPVFDAYPPEWISPYIDRRRKVGKDMYSLLGIPKGDKLAMFAQVRKNYTFFGAPVGLLFTLHKPMVPGSVLDLGIFLQSIMLAAKARGLDTCAQAAFANFHQVVVSQLGIATDQVLVCGISMGHADGDAPVNKLVTEREPAHRFATVYSD